MARRPQQHLPGVPCARAWRAKTSTPCDIDGVVSDVPAGCGTASARSWPLSSSNRRRRQPAPVPASSSVPPCPCSVPKGYSFGVRVQRENVTTGRPCASLPTDASNGCGRRASASTRVVPACRASSVQPPLDGRAPDDPATAAGDRRRCGQRGDRRFTTSGRSGEQQQRHADDDRLDTRGCSQAGDPDTHASRKPLRGGSFGG